MGVLNFIYNFLYRWRGTIFSFLISADSCSLSRVLMSWKVSLLEGMALGMRLIVLRIGSVSIFSMRDNKCSFCLLISLETTNLQETYICDICWGVWKGRRRVSTATRFLCLALRFSGCSCASGRRGPASTHKYFHLLGDHFVRLGVFPHHDWILNRRCNYYKQESWV